MAADPTRADYGLDAPRVIAGNAVAGAAAIAGGGVGWAVLRRRHRVPAAVLGGWLAGWGLVGVLQAGLMVRSSRAGKLEERDRLLDGLPWRGDERVELCDGDARRLPFGAHTFDVVVSGLALHNIAEAAERAAAVGEIARVLKPGGRVAILDFRSTRQYAAALAAAGLGDVRRSPRRFGMYPPVRVVTATKP